MALFMVCALIGILLGLRFKVFVLLPPSGILFAFLAGGAIVYDSDFGHFAVMAVLAVVCMQGGYAVGSALHATLKPSTRQHPVSSPPHEASKRAS